MYSFDLAKLRRNAASPKPAKGLRTFLSKASPTPNFCLTAFAHWTSSTSTCLKWRPGSRLYKWPPRCRDGHSPDILQNWGSCRLQRCFLWLVLPLSWMPGNLKKEPDYAFSWSTTGNIWETTASPIWHLSTAKHGLLLTKSRRQGKTIKTISTCSSLHSHWLLKNAAKVHFLHWRAVKIRIFIANSLEDGLSKRFRSDDIRRDNVAQDGT